MILLPGILGAKNLILPITIDYPLLKSLMISQLLNTPGGEHEVLNDPHGCKKIVISKPHFSEENALLKFEINVRVKAGVHLGSHCLLPIEWEGVVVFFQTPVIEPGTWMLSFQTQDSRVLDKNHEPEIISSTVWKLIKKHVHDHVSGFQVNLGPSVTHIKSFLVEMFPVIQQTQAETMTESMRPAWVEIRNKAVQIGINTNISSLYDSARTFKQTPLDEAELNRFIHAWESTDDFIVYLLGSLSTGILDQKEKDVIFETILDSRYRFISELDKPVHGNDFVRNEFILVWKRLSFLFKTHMRKNPGISPLEYLGFFSSMDALMVLDSMGPSLGIEISHNGLVRLARMIPSPNSPLLNYSREIDENLRQILDLDSRMEPSPGFIPEKPAPQEEAPYQPFLDRLLLILNHLIVWDPLSLAIAADGKDTPPMNLEDWVPPRKNILPYVRNIRKALKNASGNTLSKSGIHPDFQEVFPLIVDAVAWQESCLRQFEVKNGKIKYLRSYNNTSVGAMQINERVWRGIYDLEKLRWNIHYNMDAGSEILALYLEKYILTKTKENHAKFLENPDSIARLLYALYNGGPSQFTEFLERVSKKKLYASDDLFYEKYLWVKQEQWEKASICLLGQ